MRASTAGEAPDSRLPTRGRAVGGCLPKECLLEEVPGPGGRLSAIGPIFVGMTNWAPFYGLTRGAVKPDRTVLDVGFSVLSRESVTATRLMMVFL